MTVAFDMEQMFTSLQAIPNPAALLFIERDWKKQWDI
jgi:hypothetical protein